MKRAEANPLFVKAVERGDYSQAVAYLIQSKRSHIVECFGEMRLEDLVLARRLGSRSFWAEMQSRREQEHRANRGPIRALWDVERGAVA